MKKGISKRIRRPGSVNVRTVHGHHRAAGFRFGLVVSRFNDVLTDSLLDAALAGLTEHGAKAEDIVVVRVPGAFEIPLAMQRLAEPDEFDALIALGAVVQGETPHASLITQEVTRALSEISRKYDLPVIDGVLATLTWEQAEVRATGEREKNRGWYAALAAIEMAALMKAL